MYRAYYGLKSRPFHITPDPGFLFLSPSHAEALASLIYGIENRKGFVALTGEVGVGKTTILRSCLDKIDKRRNRIIYIFNSKVSFSALLAAICREFQLEADAADVNGMVDRIHWWLIEAHERQQNVVVIIDEAQNMPVETIENLRMLSNMETSTDKLIQIVLLGQTEFEKKLELHRLRQLKQRIAVWARISPLTRQESLAYIKHRLARASINGKPVFKAGAMRMIVKASKGMPRVLNILCDNALITGYGYQDNPAGARAAREVIHDFGRSGKKPRPPYRKSALVAGLILLMILPVIIFFFYYSGFYFFK